MTVCFKSAFIWDMVKENCKHKDEAIVLRITCLITIETKKMRNTKLLLIYFSDYHSLQ